MAWVAVDKNGIEVIYSSKPDRETEYWSNGDRYIELPENTIKKLIGRELTWDDEPVEMKNQAEIISNMKYFIIFTNKSIDTISVLELSDVSEFSIKDYLLASRQKFNNREPAVKYAKKLAKDNNINYTSDNNEDFYLD